MANERAVHPMSGPINSVVLRLTLRVTLSRKRALLFAIPAVVLIGLSLLLTKTANGNGWQPVFLGTFGYTVILALTALLVGGSVLGAEGEDGSIVHLLATPVSRRSVVLTKYLVAVGLTFVLAAVPRDLACALASGPGRQ